MKKSRSGYYSPMHSKKNLYGIVLVVIISFTIACSPALYIPDKTNISASASLPDLLAGRQLYVSKCGSCHSLVLPEKHNAEEWQVLVDKMEKKSKITHEEKKLILNYLTKGIITL